MGGWEGERLGRVHAGGGMGWAHISQVRRRRDGRDADGKTGDDTSGKNDFPGLGECHHEGARHITGCAQRKAYLVAEREEPDARERAEDSANLASADDELLRHLQMGRRDNCRHRWDALAAASVLNPGGWYGHS